MGVTANSHAPVKAQEKIRMLERGELSATQNVKYFLQQIKKSKLNAFLSVNEFAVEQAEKIDRTQKKGLLAGLVIGVKSNINVKGLVASCASKTLEQYKSTYDADVIQRILKEDGIIVGMTNCDEFACGASGEYSAFGPTENPAAPGYIPGGSSSGSAAAVAGGLCDLSLGSDTGGSIRNPASHCGVVGIKPSYGRVSRYGLIDLSMSMDQIGPFSGDCYGAALLLQVIAGHSERDASSFARPVPDYLSSLLAKKPLTIGVSTELNGLCEDKEILALVQQMVEKAVKKQRCVVKQVQLKHIDLAVQTYYPLVYTEFFSATRKFDGRRYGLKIEEACREEVLRRILGGSIISQAEYEGKYYRKALQVRRLLSEEIYSAFRGVNILVSPTVPRLPHKIGEKISVEDMYSYDAYTIPANLSGICSGSVPCGRVKNIPVGLQVMAPAFEESTLFTALRMFEGLHNEE